MPNYGYKEVPANKPYYEVQPSNPWGNIKAGVSAFFDQPSFRGEVRPSDFPVETPDSISPTQSPIDWLIPEAAGLVGSAARGMGGMGARAIRAYEGAGSALPMAAAESVGPEFIPPARPPTVANVRRGYHATPEDILYGKDMLQMTPRELGTHYNLITRYDPDTAGTMVNGAYLRQKYGTDDPSKLIELRAKEHGIPVPRLEMMPKNQQGFWASYDPRRNTIQAKPSDQFVKVPDQNAFENGILAAHEPQHAIDAYAGYKGVSEYFGNSAKKVKALEDQSLALKLFNPWDNPNRLKLTVDKLMGERGEVFNPQKDFSLVDPYSKAPLTHDQIKKLVNRTYDDARLGDPMHQMKMRSVGHFKDYTSFEGQFAQKQMVIDALKAGESVNPALIREYRLQHLVDAYKSPIRPQK